MRAPYLTPERLREIRAGHAKQRHVERAEATRAGALTLTNSEQERLGSASPYRPFALHARPDLVSKRWPHAVARIYRILQGVAKGSTMTDAVSGAEYPELAKQYTETWIYYLTRAKPAPVNKTDHNPFRNLSDFDAMRKFIRCVEDICDRSTGKLGSWYVK